MWPWTHALIALIAHLTYCLMAESDRPGVHELFFVVFGSLAPDLIDKPMAWVYRIFPTGYALGHSVVFSIPVAITAILLGRAIDRPRYGIAFSIGYLLHLPADVYAHSRRTRRLQLDIVSWPWKNRE